MKKTTLYIFGSKIFFNLFKELSDDYILENIDHISIKKNFVIKNNDDSVIILFIENFKKTDFKLFFKEEIPTIFLLNNINDFKNYKVFSSNFHVILSLPINIFSLIDIIKILITKYSYFKNSKIRIKNYILDSNQRLIVKKNLKSKLTEKELKLILALHKNNGLAKNDLLTKVWNHNAFLDTHVLETHLHRLRKKIKKVFNDNQFITEINSLYYIQQ
jgi:DNA-binding response OmpR family regulator